MKKIIVAAVFILMAAGFIIYQKGKEETYLRPCGGARGRK